MCYILESEVPKKLFGTSSKLIRTFSIHYIVPIARRLAIVKLNVWNHQNAKSAGGGSDHIKSDYIYNHPVDLIDCMVWKKGKGNQPNEIYQKVISRRW